MTRRHVYFLVFFLTLTLAFYLKSMLYLDPDLGWQLKTGELILTEGFPRTDPFSYTMPHFAFVPHSWLSDVAFFKIFQAFGFAGLAMTNSIVLAATVMIVCGFLGRTWMYIPAVLVAAHFFPYAGMRPQTFSWLFFSLLLGVLLNERTTRRFGRYLPLMFFLWAQLHGGFFIGIVLLATWAFFDLKKRSALAILATAATLFNPYGTALWREVITTFFSLTTRASVNEWTPTLAQLDIRLGLIMLLPTFLIMRYPRAYSPFFNISYFILFFLMLSSSKLFPFWLIMAGYTMITGFTSLEKSAARIAGAIKRFNTLFYILFLFAAINTIILSTATVNTYKALHEDIYYPKKAVAYLHTNPPQGNIFAPFGWGGYLIWKLPEKKVFISGHMPHWENILEDYIKIIKLESPFKKVAVTYNISTVLVQKNKTNFEALAKNLTENGWEKTYEDDMAVILSKP